MPEETTNNHLIRKHPLWIRWAHWINFPMLLLMIISGVMIYWANDIYWPHIPDSVYKFLKVDHHLAQGMAIHFTFMWIFGINGLLYFLYLIFSGEGRKVWPDRQSLKDAFLVVLHDLGLRKEAPPQLKYNAAQRIAYTSVTIMGLGSLITGLMIYKPVQVYYLTNLVGGYASARLIHYILTWGYLLFFAVHIGQVIRAGWNNFQAMISGFEVEEIDPNPMAQKKILFSFGVFAIVVVVGMYFLNLAFTSPEQDKIPSSFRAVMGLNEQVSTAVLGVSHVPPERPSVLPGKPARVNGEIGLDDDDEIDNWQLEIASGQASPELTKITLDDLKKLPFTKVSTEFRCIEGWNEDMSFGGVRFSDFLNTYHLGTKSGKPIDPMNPDDMYKYVGLETPDGEYFVSMDMRSMLHPNTLLAFEQNGEPLTLPHGAPLRLYAPNKYGVKSLKRIGKIFFSDERPRDYWAQQGYDYFIGL